MNSLLTRLHDRLGLRTSPAVFFSAAAVIILFTVARGVLPGPVQAVFGAAAHWLRYDVGWFYTLAATLLLAVCLILAVSRYGRVKLGDDDASPEYSGLAWFGMMFASGIGAVLMFWGIAEPMTHYALPPLEGTEPYSDQAAVQALNIANLHFGLHMWAILVVPGLCFGYFTYKRNLPPRVSSAFQLLLGDRIHGPIGKTIDVIAIVSTVFGMGVSTGMGALQINAGVNYVVGVPVAGWVQALILAVALMLWVLMWAASSMDVVRGVIESFGRYLGALPLLTTFNDTLGGGTWSGDWTLFYWAWTVSWAPSVGMFVARISRGRTIREFVFASLGLPTAFVIVWMGVYGYSAIFADRAAAPEAGTGGPLAQTIAVEGNVQVALFQSLQEMPLYLPIAVLALIVIVIFFVTSIDSGALVMDAMANGHEDLAPRRQRVFWGVSVGAVCTAIIVTAGDDGLNALREVIIVIGFPVMVLTVLQALLLLQALREDAGAARPLRTRQWKRVLPPEEYHRRAREDATVREEYAIRPEFEVGTEPEYETHTPNTWHAQQPAARRATVSVGLTGGVASGKSAVAAEFERLGAVVVDYDDLMREILVPGHPAVDELRDVFTAEVVADDGTVDWLALDALTAESPSARTRLHEVVAPVVRAETDRRATDAGESSVLVVDLALLVDAADVRDFDQVLEVLAPAEVRVARLMDERGLDREQAWAEVDADEQRRPALGGTHTVLANEGDRAELERSVRDWWDEVVEPARERGRRPGPRLRRLTRTVPARRAAAGGDGRGWRPGAGSPYRRDRVPDGTRPSARPLDRPPRSVGDPVPGDS